MPKRLLAITTAFTALSAIAPCAVALAEEAVPPPAQAPASTTVTTAPAAPPAAEAPASQAQPSTTTTQTAAPAAPQVNRSNPQPASAAPRPPAVSAHHRTAAKHGKRSAKHSASRAAGSPAAHAPAVAPSAVTPPVPTALGAVGGVPSFFINSFAIPPFLLPIYQAAGAAYGIPWEVLAAINEVETDYGRDLSVSSAGAEGWMQFMPSEWAKFGVDVNNDGYRDPYNPADAVFAAARYLQEAGGAHDIRAAVFAYNHSASYVESVMLRARLLSGTPPTLLKAITGLTEARFPVHAPSHFSDGFPSAPGGGALAGTTIYSQAGAPVIAVQDGSIDKLGSSPALGRFLSLRDAYGNTYTYAQLGSVSRVYPVLEAGPKRFSLHPLRAGVHVIAGTVLGHLQTGAQPHMLFQIRPSGIGAPLIDPKPILDGWVKLEDSTAMRPGPAKAPAPSQPSAGAQAPGQVLLQPKGQLERRLRHDRRVRLAACERRLIADGRVDRRVLAALEFLSASGMRIRVSTASCAPPRGVLPAPVENSSLQVADISAVDGMPVARGGHALAAARAAVKRLLALQGATRPLAIAGPHGLPKDAAVLALPGYPNRIHIAFDASASAHSAGLFSPGLSSAQWVALMARLGQIPDPAVPAKPSAAAIPAGASAPGRGA